MFGINDNTPRRMTKAAMLGSAAAAPRADRVATIEDFRRLGHEDGVFCGAQIVAATFSPDRDRVQEAHYGAIRKTVADMIGVGATAAEVEAYSEAAMAEIGRRIALLQEAVR